MAKQQNETKTIDSVLEAINKRYGKGTITSLGSNEKSFVKTISTGSLAVDEALGGGYAIGRLVEIFGEPSVGKSTWCMEAIANVQRNGGKCLYLDFENVFDKRYSEALGVNSDELLFVQPNSAEEGLQILLDLLETNQFSLIVVDSIAAMIPEKVFEADVGDATIGLLARLLSTEIPKVANKALKSNCTVLLTNQTRTAIGGYGGGVSTPGGKAIPFYTSQRIQLFKGQVANDHGEAVGNNSWCRVVKNKVAPPLKEAQYTIKYGKGFDKVQEILDFAVKYDIVQKGGSWYSYGETKLGQGNATVVSLLEDNPELLDEIKAKVYDKMK